MALINSKAGYTNHFADNKLLIFVLVLALAGGIGFAMAQQPLLSLAAMGLVVIGAVTLLWPDLPTLVVVFILYSNAAVVAVKFHGLPYLVGSAVPMLLVIPITAILVFKRQKIILGPVFILLLTYLAIQLVSSLFSRYTSQALDEVFTYILEGVVLYFLLVNTVRTTAMLRRAIWALLLAGILLGGVPLYQQITGTFENEYGGFGQTTGSSFQIEEESLLGEVRQPRLAGAIGEKNYYAQVMLMLVPLGLTIFWSERSRLLRGLALAATGLAGAGMVLAFSRGAAVGFVLLFAIMIFLRLIKPYQLAIFAGVTIVLLLAFPQYNRRLLSLSSLSALFSDNGESGDVDSAFEGRATEMLAATLVFADHPIIGVGPGIFKYYSSQYGNDLGLKTLYGFREAHSLYLGIAADTGALGLICFLAILLFTLRNLAQVRNKYLPQQPGLANIAVGFMLAVIAFMTTGLFLHLSYLRFFTLILALANVIPYVACEEADLAFRSQPRQEQFGQAREEAAG